VTIDVGTGDGRAVLAAACARPARPAIGMDASAAADGRGVPPCAAGPARKGGPPERGVRPCRAESPPRELACAAGLVTVQFHGVPCCAACSARDDRVAAGSSPIWFAADGTLALLLAPAAQGRLHGLPTEPRAVLDAAASGVRALRPGALVEARPATGQEVRASGSTWARRLGSERAAVLIRMARR
jgi:16S rRNA (adenine(1408)-N(1))-methyltransferase